MRDRLLDALELEHGSVVLDAIQHAPPNWLARDPIGAMVYELELLRDIAGAA